MERLMPLTFEEKKQVVERVNAVASHAVSAAVAENTGLNAAEMTSLRVKARNAKMFLKVIPNKLAKRALKDTDFSCLEEKLVGPILLIFSNDEPGAPAKLVAEFIKTNEKLKVKALAIGSNAYEAVDLERIASLPSKPEAISRLLCVIKEPITQFVRTLAEPHAKLVRTISAIKDNMQ
jgi:large subunit ribosomal protein L10